MSTRSTLWYSDEIHLYREGFDDSNVYIEFSNATPYLENLIIKIPLTAWKEMRQHTIEPAERYLDLSDEELRAEAVREVADHRAELDEIRARENERARQFLMLSGVLLFGDPDSSEEEMIDSFVSFYRPAKGQT